MSEDPVTTQTPAPPAPTAAQASPAPAVAPAPSPASSSTSSVAFGGIFSVVAGLASAALGAGWPGVIALGGLALILGIGLPTIYNKLVGDLNRRIDGRDNANAGADAGKTSVDLANQGHDVRTGLDAAEQLDPPQKPQA